MVAEGKVADQGLTEDTERAGFPAEYRKLIPVEGRSGHENREGLRG
jgi:hypothetical protein